VQPLALVEVDERDLDVVAAGPAALLPESGGAAHVHDAERARQVRGEALEQLEAARAQAVTERIGPAVGGQLAQALGCVQKHV